MPRTLIEVDRSSDEPLYRQVRRAIEHGIAVGTFDPAHRLPSSRELAVELGVSRNTINLAYQELVAEGLVDSQERRGLFVNPEMRRHCASEWRATTPSIDWTARIRRGGDAYLPHIEKHVDWHRYPYPFLAGQIDVGAFPARSWARCLRDALAHPHIHHSLQDSVAADDPMLVEMIRRHLLPARGIEAAPEEVLITVGSQQGLDLLTRVLLRAEHTVGVEDPGYLDAWHIFLRAGARLRGLPVDAAGARPPRSFRGTDLLYLTPSHHHPTNATLSMSRRHQILDSAASSGTVVVEDDYDSEFRYRGRPTPALKALDATGDAVYLGTFSKFLSPGLRLGYLVGPAELVAELREVRRYSCRHPSGHLQRALAMLIDSGEYHRSLRRYRGRLLRKWEAITDAVRRYLPWPQQDYPPGGVSLWMSGPSELDCRALAREAERRGVLIEPGDLFFLPEAGNRQHFRLGFAATPLRDIAPGVRLLGEAARELLDGRRSNGPSTTHDGPANGGRLRGAGRDRANPRSG